MKLFKGLREKAKIAKMLIKGEVYGITLYTNDHLSIISDACSICYDNNKERTQEEKAEYIGRRIKTGHESILEHSNVVTYYIIQKTEHQLQNLTQLLDVNKYLNMKTHIEKDTVYLLMGGSIRGYKHIIRNIKNLDNELVKAIIQQLYILNKEYFFDFIEDGIMDINKFCSIEYDHVKNDAKGKTLDIINIDDIQYIQKLIDNKFPIEDLFDIGTITVLFKDVSRIISQQLTRHRDAITQLSQRYVDYSKDKFKFNSPSKFKPDKYSEENNYTIKMLGKEFTVTLQDLGNMLMDIYPQLVDKSLGDKRLIPEDARAFLPNNATTSLYMTFTFKNWIKFLQLRTDSHAQAEIRLIAEEGQSYTRPILEKMLGTIAVQEQVTKNNFELDLTTETPKSMYDILEPYYKKDVKETIDYYKDIDEPVK